MALTEVLPGLGTLLRRRPQSAAATWCHPCYPAVPLRRATGYFCPLLPGGRLLDSPRHQGPRKRGPGAGIFCLTPISQPAGLPENSSISQSVFTVTRRFPMGPKQRTVK